MVEEVIPPITIKVLDGDPFGWLARPWCTYFCTPFTRPTADDDHIIISLCLYVILHYIISYHIKLYYIILYYIVLYYIIL